MRPPFDRLIRRLRTLRRPGAAELTFVGVALACVLLPQWWALSRSREQRKEELRAALLTTLETTKDAVRGWRRDRIATARRIADSREVRSAAAELFAAEEPDPATLGAAIDAVARRLSGHETVILGYALVDRSGAPLAADRTEDTQLRFDVEAFASDDDAQRMFRWPGERSGSLVGAAAPLSAMGQDESGFLLIRFDALPGLETLLASRTLGDSGRTTLYDASRTWVSLSASGAPADCDKDPPDMVRSASGTGARAESGAGAYNLEGFPGCSGRKTLAAWSPSGVLDLALLTEISAEEAYRSHSATRVTFLLLGLALGACFLVFVLIQTSSEDSAEPRRVNPRRNLAAWGILSVALMATAIGWLSARSRLEQTQRQQFEEAAENVRARFAERLLHYESALRVASASHAPLAQSDPSSWRSLIQKLHPPSEYPALTCIALLRPSGEPRMSTAPALRCSDSVPSEQCRLCAAAPALAPELSLDDGPGVVSLATVRADEDAESSTELVLLRPANPGSETVVGASLDVETLVRDLPLATGGLDLDVFLELDQEEPVELLRASDPDAAGGVDRLGASKAFAFELGGRRMRLVLTPAPRLTPPISQNYPAQVLLAGLAISVLLFDIALVLSSTRARALSIAELMTRRYRESEIRIRAVIDNAPDGVLTFDSVGIVHTFNPGAEKLFGYSPEEVAEIRIQDLLPVCIPGVVSQLAESSPDGGAECEGRRKDGSMFPAELTISRMQMSDRVLYTAIVRDVSARREAEERLRESEERYALAARGANDGLWDWDLRKNEVHYSERWKSMVGAGDSDVGTSPDEWLGRVHSEDVVSLRAKLADHLEGRVDHFECEYRIRHETGGYRWVLTRGIAVRDQQGRATRIAGSQSDITERKRAERQLLYDALHDPLTGLPNRSYFMSRVDQTRAEAARSSRRLFGVLFLDIDRFKIVNDSLGHHVGDQLLVSVAERLKSCLRPGDTICRLGGDEFAILVENLSGVADATQIAERIQSELEAPVRAGEREMYAAVSIGIALSSTGRQSAEELVRDADIAMYRAKSRGKARYELFTQRMHTKAVELLQMETDLRQAIEQDQIVLHYQPILDLAEQRVHALEALMRWNHPSRGIVPPGDFIHIAEESGAILRMTTWLLDRTCRCAKSWREVGSADLFVSLNISPRQLQQGGLYELVMEALSNHDLDPSALQLELTESALLESSEPNVDTLRRLFKDGVRITLDDFGTGYSSLMYLKRFPLHGIKIDKSFVQRLPSDSGNAAIASGLIGMAQSLSLRVTAEGVETAEQLRFLREQGCDEVQGYLFSRALEGEKVREFLLDREHISRIMRQTTPLPSTRVTSA